MFRELFETAPDAMVVVDRSGTIVRANVQAVRLFAFSEEELVGQPIEMLMPERVRTSHRAHVGGYAANPRVRPMGSGQELIGRKKDGSQFPVEIALSPLNTPEGKLFLASVRDVSETQRARQALTRARYDSFVSQISQSMLVAPSFDVAIANIPESILRELDVSGAAVMTKHQQFNQMIARAVAGVDVETVESLPWHKVVHAAATGAFQAPITLNDTAGFAAIVVAPLFDQAEIIGSLLALSKESRTFDHDALNCFQSLANLLTSAMQRMRMEERLSHAQRLEAIGQLTGGVAHDFNNLLTVISGNLQILEEELADRPSTQEIIATALRAVARGSELTLKLLAFARKQRLSPVDCDPSFLLKELGAMLKRTLGETIQLEISCPADIARVFADPAQLDGALVNLALNARDAMPRGGRLSIAAELECVSTDEATDELGAGDYIVFSVRDTGLGMTPDTLAHAFEPFFTTKEVGKGSGLGLSMVYGFVKQSHGHLSVESQLGYGTCIRLHLPKADGGVAATTAPATAPSHGIETVLVVEDENDVRSLAVRFLEALGYVTIAAADAERALVILHANPQIALLFSDVVLGSGMNGAELAVEAQQLRPDLRVLLTSGYQHAGGDNADMTDRFELLQKPYRREDLSQAIRRVLDTP